VIVPSFSIVPHKVSARFTDPIVSPLATIGVTPNMISVAGFAGNVAAACLAAGGHFFWAGVVMLFFSALDLLDGALARKTGTVTKFGAVFDSVLDRLSEAVVLAGLLYHYTETGDATLEIVLIYAAIVGSIMVSYVRARAEGIGLELREGLFTRAERVLVLGVALLAGSGAIPWALGLLALLSNATALQRLFAVWQKLRSEAA
jgi:CDP-diacylglycerol--glycerol-3-phosphate 3-phosphatidyltransferase